MEIGGENPNLNRLAYRTIVVAGFAVVAFVAVLMLFSQSAKADVILDENFDGSWPPTGWTIIDGGGDGATWKQSSDHGGFGGSGTWATCDSDADGLGVWMQESLISPPIDTTGYSELYLSFYHYFNALWGDYAQLEISTDNGTTWTIIQTWTSDTLGYEEFDISAYVGYTQVKIKFYYDDNNIWAWWWCVDNVQVVAESVANDVGVSSLNITPFIGSVGSPFNINATVSNFGTANQTNVEVKMEVYQWLTPTVILDENFDGSWPPTGWTIIDGGGDGATWKQSSDHGGFGGSGTWATCDSDADGLGVWMQESLISPPIDTTGYSQLYLSFYHNFNAIGFGDYAQLEISTDNGTTWTPIQTWTSDTLGYEEFDISAYIGYTQVKIKFYYDDNNVWAWWWCVDNVQVYQPPGKNVFYSDNASIPFIEAGGVGYAEWNWTPSAQGTYYCDAWTELPTDEDNTNNLSTASMSVAVWGDNMEFGEDGWWHTTLTPGLPDYWHLSTYDYNSPTHSWADNNPSLNYYDTQIDNVLVSPPINGSCYSVLTLTFWHYYDFNVYWGAYTCGGILEASIDNITWEQVFPDGGYPGTIRHNYVGGTSLMGYEAYVGTSPGWVQATFNLSKYAGENPFYLRFHVGTWFYSYLGLPYAGYGWFIDDIILTGQSYDHDVGVHSINMDEFIQVGYDTPINVTFRNYGWYNQTFNASAEITYTNTTTLLMEGFEQPWVPDSDGDDAPMGWENNITNSGSNFGFPCYWAQMSYNAHSGSYHAGLWWSYSDQDEQLYTPVLNLPAGAQQIELRLWFWHYNAPPGWDDWFWVNVTDADMNHLTTLINLEEIGSPTAYEYEVILDMTAFAGQSVRVKFHAYGPSGGLYSIAFLDDVKIVTVATEVYYSANVTGLYLDYKSSMYYEFIGWKPKAYGEFNITVSIEKDGDEYIYNNISTKIVSVVTFFLQDDVEGGNIGWTIDNSSNPSAGWQLVEDGIGANGYAHSKSPTHSWYCGNDTTGTYPDDDSYDWYLISPSMNFIAAIDATLYYYADWHTDDSYASPTYEGWQIDVSIDGGATWSQVGYHWFRTSGFYNPWEESFGAVLGQEDVRFRFWFHTTGNNDNVYETVPRPWSGLFVDEMMLIGMEYLNNIAIANMYQPDVVQHGDNFTVNVTIANGGALDQSNFNVSFSVEYLGSIIYEENYTVPFLQNKTSMFHEFTFTPPYNGTYNITVQSWLPGDELPWNDVGMCQFDVGHIFFEDQMETTPTTWFHYADAGPDQWHMTNGTYYSPVTSWWCADEVSGVYADNMDASLQHDDINLIPAKGANLSFRYKGRIEGFYDHGYVEVSKDNMSWEILADFSGINTNIWTRAKVEIPADYLGWNISIRFRLVSDWIITYQGWFIDSVYLYGWGVNYDAKAGDIIHPTGALVGDQINFTAEIQNAGLKTLPPFDVKINIYFSYNGTSVPGYPIIVNTGITLNSAWSTYISFSYTPTILSTFIVNVTTLYPNDEYNENNYTESDVFSAIFWDDIEPGPESGWTDPSETPGLPDLWHVTNYTYYSPTHSWACNNESEGAGYNSVNALTDSPTGNYADSYYGGARMAFGVDLTATTSPTLSIYVHYDIESYWDAAACLISTDGGSTWTWIQPIGGYPYTGGYFAGTGWAAAWSGSQGTWTNYVFDLSGYTAYSDVRIGFFLASDFIINYDGFYVDNVSIDDGATNLFFDGFEAGLGNWDLDTPWGYAEIPEPRYMTQVDCTLISPGIDSSGASQLILVFMHYYEFNVYWGANTCGGIVEISNDNYTWEKITPQGGYPGQVNHNYVGGTSINRQEAYVGSSGGWVSAYFDISQYAGTTVWIRWHMGTWFYSYASWGQAFGWAIDDILLTGMAFEHDVGIAKINVADEVQIGENLTINATLRNYGMHTETFNATATVYELNATTFIDTSFEDAWVPDSDGDDAPGPGWEVIVTNSGTNFGFPCYWAQMSFWARTGIYHAGLWWSWSPQDEWLITPSIDLTNFTEAELRFYWGHFQPPAGWEDNFYVHVSTDNGATWPDTLIDLSTIHQWPPYQDEMVLDLSAYAGQTIRIAWQAVSGASSGLYSIAFLDDVQINGITRNIIWGPETHYNITIAGGYGASIYEEWQFWKPTMYQEYLIEINTSMPVDNYADNDVNNKKVDVVFFFLKYKTGVDDVETGQNGWTTSMSPGAEDLWHIVEDGVGANGYAHSVSKSHSWFCGNDTTGRYPDDNSYDWYLYTPELDLRAATSAYLAYYADWHTDDSYSYPYYEHWEASVSTDGGFTWTALNGWFRTSGFYIPQSYSLNAYVGEKIIVRFWLHTTGNNDNIYETVPRPWSGVFLDDIKVVGTEYLNNLAPTWVYVPDVAEPGSPIPINATIENLGALDQSNFNVSCEVYEIVGGGVMVSENFDGAWGPYGDNPPAGWAIYDYGSLADGWNTNDWHRYYWSYTGSYSARVYYYPTENQDEWLVTEPPLDFTGLTGAYIEFDHYFNEYAGAIYPDACYVDVSTDNSTWITVLAYEDTDSPYPGSHEVLDISSIADGQPTVWIRFRYVGFFGWYWYVDNVEIGADPIKNIVFFDNATIGYLEDHDSMTYEWTYTPTFTGRLYVDVTTWLPGDEVPTNDRYTTMFDVVDKIFFQDDFEPTPVAGWTHYAVYPSTLDLWDTYTGDAYSLPHSYYCGYQTIMFYDNDMDNALETPDIYIWSSAKYLNLSFRAKGDMAAGDYAYIDISTDGQPWQTIGYATLYSDWTRYHVDLATYKDHDLIKLRFRLQSDSSGVSVGWMLDDIFLWGTIYTDNVGMFNLTCTPPYIGAPNETVLIEADVRNLGTNATGDFDVVVNVTKRTLGGVLEYIEFINTTVVNLPNFLDTAHLMWNWTPPINDTSPGLYYITVTSYMPGDEYDYDNVTPRLPDQPFEYFIGAYMNLSTEPGWYTYTTRSVLLIFDEDFNGAWGPYGNNPPAGWTIYDYGDETIPTWNYNDWHRYYWGYTSSYSARVNQSPVENQDEWLVSPEFNCTGFDSVSLDFDTYFHYWYDADIAYVDITTDNGATWNNIVTYTSYQYGHRTYDISTWAANQSSVQIRFRYVGYNGYVWYVDNVKVSSFTILANATGILYPWSLDGDIITSEYDAGDRSALTSPYFDVYNHTILVFVLDVNLSAGDTVELRVSNNDFVTYTLLDTFTYLDNGVFLAYYDLTTYGYYYDTLQYQFYLNADPAGGFGFWGGPVIIEPYDVRVPDYETSDLTMVPNDDWNGWNAPTRDPIYADYYVRVMNTGANPETFLITATFDYPALANWNAANGARAEVWYGGVLQSADIANNNSWVTPLIDPLDYIELIIRVYAPNITGADLFPDAQPNTNFNLLWFNASCTNNPYRYHEILFRATIPEPALDSFWVDSGDDHFLVPTVPNFPATPYSPAWAGSADPSVKPEGPTQEVYTIRITNNNPDVTEWFLINASFTLTNWSNIGTWSTNIVISGATLVSSGITGGGLAWWWFMTPNIAPLDTATFEVTVVGPYGNDADLTFGPGTYNNLINLTIWSPRNPAINDTESFDLRIPYPEFTDIHLWTDTLDYTLQGRTITIWAYFFNDGTYLRNCNVAITITYPDGSEQGLSVWTVDLTPYRYTNELTTDGIANEYFTTTWKAAGAGTYTITVYINGTIAGRNITAVETYEFEVIGKTSTSTSFAPTLIAMGVAVAVVATLAVYARRKRRQEE